jgi:hypothetical protein
MICRNVVWHRDGSHLRRIVISKPLSFNHMLGRFGAGLTASLSIAAGAMSSSTPNAAPPPRSPGTGIFRLTYPAPGAIIAPSYPLQAFGLHDSNCLNRHTDDALRLPGLVQLETLIMEYVIRPYDRPKEQVR